MLPDQRNRQTRRPAINDLQRTRDHAFRHSDCHGCVAIVIGKPPIVTVSSATLALPLDKWHPESTTRTRVVTLPLRLYNRAPTQSISAFIAEVLDLAAHVILSNMPEKSFTSSAKTTAPTAQCKVASCPTTLSSPARMLEPCASHAAPTARHRSVKATTAAQHAQPTCLPPCPRHLRQKPA